MAGYFYNFVIVYKKWGLVDRSYFFSNQEGSAFPVDSNSFCKSFIEAMYNGPGIPKPGFPWLRTVRTSQYL